MGQTSVGSGGQEELAPGSRQPDADDNGLDQAAPRNRWLALAIVLSGVFMQMLDTTITMVAVPPIQADLGASSAELELIIAGYSLAFACVLITGGRLGDLYGRKRVFLIGLTGFTLASALCGAAPDAPFLVAARIFQGVCAGLMFPQALSILQTTFPKKERPKALAIYGACVGLAMVCGPVLGGSLIELDLFGTDWRMIFYVNLPIGITALILGVGVIGESRAFGAPRLDVVGALLVTAGLFLLVLPLVLGQEEDWPAWTFWMMGGSLLVLGLFYLFERRLTARSAGTPLLRTTLFRQRGFTMGLLVNLVVFMGVPAFFFISVMTLQVAFEYSAIGAGAALLWFAAMVGAGSGRSAQVVRKLGTWTLTLGLTLMTLGMVGVIITVNIVETDLRGWQLAPALMVAGLGGGFFLAPVISVVIASIRSEDAGTASGVLATAQQVGAAIGIAVIGVLFFGFIGDNAQRSLDETEPQLRASLVEYGLPEPAIEEIVAGFGQCFDDRAQSQDLSETPESCGAMRERMAASPLPDEAKELTARAIEEEAAPLALKTNFARSYQQAVWWQVGVFGVGLLLTLALPKVKPKGGVTPGGVG